MKKMYKMVFIIGMMVLPLSNYAQVSSLGNAGINTDYVGWNNLQAFPLQIRHNANQPIDFYTNNSASPRMRIANTGWVGVGSSNPSSVLNLNKANTGEMFRTNGGWSMENRWRLFMTDTVGAIEQFRLFVRSNTSSVFLQAQQDTANLSFNTAGGVANLVPDTKLRIFPDDKDRIVAFENPFLSSSVGFMPDYNAKFIINDRNNLVSLPL